MDITGIEPVASDVQDLRSTNWAKYPKVQLEGIAPPYVFLKKFLLMYDFNLLRLIVKFIETSFITAGGGDTQNRTVIKRFKVSCTNLYTISPFMSSVRIELTTFPFQRSFFPLNYKDNPDRRNRTSGLQLVSFRNVFFRTLKLLSEVWFQSATVRRITVNKMLLPQP